MGNPKHEELKPETVEKELPCQKREGSKAKRTQKGVRPKEHMSPSDRRITQNSKVEHKRKRETEDAASDNHEGKPNEETVAKGPTRRGKERCQEKEAHRAEGSYTEKRRGAQRPTMKPNQGKQGASKST